MPDPLTLDPELSLGGAADLAAALAARRGNDLTLDASAVEHLSAPAAQVLLAARRAWDGDGKSLAIADPSDPFRTCLDLLGLGDTLLEEQS